MKKEFFDPLEDPKEREAVQKVWQRVAEDDRLDRKKRLENALGPNPPPEVVLALSRHFDHLHADLNRKKIEIEVTPTEEELENFKITPENWTAALSFYREHRDELIRNAILQLENAVSHRNPPFKVGCVAVSIGPDVQLDDSGAEKSVYKIWGGYNLKIQPSKVEGGQKLCAERNALNEAHFRSKAVFAIVTASKELSTGDPTLACSALHPCLDCRKMFRKFIKEGFLREDTIICNTNNATENIATEERTLGELLNLYKDDPKDYE